MGNGTLTDVFKDRSLKEIYRGEHFDGMTFHTIGLLSRIVDDLSKRDIAGIFEFLSEPDALFLFIYNLGKDDIYYYPFVDDRMRPRDMHKAEGPVGAQYSRYHWELLWQHVCYVVAKLVEQGHFTVREAVLLAIWHDVGKKYTTATNSRGEICFYNHASVSAFLATKALDPKLEYEERKRLIAIIYGHMQPLTLWNRSTDYETGEPIDAKMDFFKELLEFFDGDYALAGRVIGDIEKFGECDLGITQDHINDPDVCELIEKGKQIILSA